jgi:hypothetical protein
MNLALPLNRLLNYFEKCVEVTAKPELLINRLYVLAILL